MNNNYTYNNPEEEEDGVLSNIDYMRLLRNALKNWWVIFLSVGISLAVSLAYNNYAQRIYKATTVILLKDNSKTQGFTDLTEGFGLSQEMSNIENQRYIYTSPKNVARAIDRLDFEITYTNIGRIKNEEVYGAQQVIRIDFDTTHCQPIGAIFEIEHHEGNYIKLHIKGDEIYGYDYMIGDYTNYYAENVDTTFIIEIGEKITNRMFSFAIMPYDYIKKEDLERKIRFNFNTRQSLISKWRNSLSVSINEEGGTVAFISAIGTNRNKTLAFLNAMNEASMYFNLDKKNQTATRTLSFLKTQLASIADSLKKAQQKLLDFRQRNNFASNPQHLTNLHSNYYAKEKELETAMLEYEYLKMIQNKLKTGETIEDFFIASVGSQNVLVQRQLQELIALQQELNNIKTQNDNNPYKKRIVEQEDMLRKNMLVMIEQNMQIQEKLIATINNSMQKMTNKVGEIPTIESEYANLERNYKIQDAVYTFLLEKESETLIAKASNVCDNDILQEPTYDGKIAPIEKKNNTMALAIGFLLPAAILFLQELLNNKVRSLKELRRTCPNTTILGIVPQDHSEPHSDLPTINDPLSITSECFRTLRAKLNFIVADNGHKLILLSSCNPGEGKTYCVVNLAVNFALSGLKCAIINYDLRRPRLEKALNLPRGHKGITDYLVFNAEMDEIIQKTDIDNLFCITSGSIPPNPTELISTKKNKELIDEMKNRFDMILIDTAPVGCVADCRTLMPYADAFLFIVRANHTEYKHLKTTLDSLNITDNKPSLSLLFNGASTNDNETKHYGSYYGYQIKNPS